MRIVVDENIPYGKEAFETLGDVVLRPGRGISKDDLKDAELLLVRSITKVNADLLEGTKVRFVATATIGEDHVDKEYLHKKGIAFSSAPGCNANSVADYIVATLLHLAEVRGFKLTDRKLGIVGHGNVGSKVARRARALGMQCVVNDPPLARKTGDATFRPLDEIFDCNIITFHVPLTKTGPDATYHLVDDAFLRKIRTGTLIINTSRGSVIDGKALQAALEDGRVGASALDVWEGEPNIDLDLFANLALGTPHIAGYSFDGKVNGTRQVYEAACAYLGVNPNWDPSLLLPAPETPVVEVDGSVENAQAELRRVVRCVYDILRDDEALRAIIKMPAEERGPHFDRLRKEYPRRREFFNTKAVVTPSNPALEQALAGIGFTL
ncbi:MAG: 4-phosphoerythronate dehydrogenase PdxB [Candidatus Hydrogenedentes bacterium]|nr:4-phosphoerythronate dehydrogenase PdxB [Candidatus Hydrogenedentota bacterium]